MTLTVLLFCLCHICVDRVLWILYICNISTSFLLNLFTIFTYPVFLYGILYALLWRFWIIRYDIQMVRASMNQKWRSIINEEYIEQNWYLSNKAKWGNSRFIASYIIAPLYLFCIAVSLIIRFQIYRPSSPTSTAFIHFWAIDMTFSMVPYCIIVYVWIKTPSFNDTFWIHDASKLIFIVLLILFLADITSGILTYLDLKSEQFVLLSVIESHIICGANFALIMIMTFGVFYKNQTHFLMSSSLLILLFGVQSDMNASPEPTYLPNGPHLTLAPTDSAHRTGNKTCTPANTIKKLTLKAVLKDPMLFHTFMGHLATEFSMECLLAIVEFTEYQEYCIDNLTDYLSTKHDYRGNLVELPPNIPRSLIVYGSTKKPHNKALNHMRIITPMIHNLSLRIHRSASGASGRKESDQESNSERRDAPKTPPKPSTLSAHPLASTLADHASDPHPIEIVPGKSNSMPSTLSLQRAYSDTGVPSLLLGNSSNNSNSKSKKRESKPSKGLYNELKPFQMKAKRLYEKYIEVGAEYEINISYDLRNSFNKMLNNDELWSVIFDGSNKNRNKFQNEKIIAEKLHEILSLLDQSIHEMLRLLGHSFSRFRKTDTYNKLLRIHKYS
eukprot:185139_1